MVTMEESSSFFTPIEVFAVYTLTIFRAKNIGLEALTILFKAIRLLAVATLVVLPKQRKVTSLLLAYRIVLYQ